METLAYACKYLPICILLLFLLSYNIEIQTTFVRMGVFIRQELWTRIINFWEFMKVGFSFDKIPKNFSNSHEHENSYPYILNWRSLFFHM
jgi:hypothetical protein